MLPNIYQILTNDLAVSALIGNNVFRHGSAPQGVIAPYVTWFVVSALPENSISDLPNMDLYPIQVDVYHKTDAGVIELAQAVRGAIEPNAHMTNMPINERDEDTKLFHIALEFDWWLSR